MEDSSFQSPVNQFSYNSETQKKPKKFVYLIILLVILGGFFLIRNFFFGPNKEKQTSETTPTPTEYQFPTDTPVPSISPTVEIEKPTVAPTKSVNPVDQSTGLDRSTLSVEVQNGSGEAGAAGKGAEVLKGFGYKITSMGNADNFDYQNATVKVKSTKSNYLALLKKDLGFSYTVGSASADLSSSFSADALVIIGK
jgi:cytoskeletal protein RodZ